MTSTPLRRVPAALAALLLVAAPAAQAQAPISEAEVMAAQEAWGKAIVAIGAAAPGEARPLAQEVIADLYGYALGPVLFKPTKAAEDQFRTTPEEALSYFVTGIRAEDSGFALQPWSAVRFETEAVAIDADSAVAMGNYYFTDATTGDDVKVEYTMGFRRDGEGDLVLFLHHSSLPFVPAD